LEAVSKKISAQLLLSRIPHTDSKEPPYLRRLSTSWKYQVMEVLPRFEVFQLFSLFDKMVIIKDQLDLNHEKDFFKSLETASISHLADFNKKQLMDIIWVFVQLGITPPSEEFVSAWRESAMTKRRKFSAQDRYGLHGFFRQLEITPLSYPY
ncbi:MAG: hypothetical protein OXN83_03970, partial [Oligoflexia bacterium]|nr:hypothetical protein [Oligoflexia bacterium]